MIPPFFGDFIPLRRFAYKGIAFVEYNGPDAPSPEIEYGRRQTTGRRRLFCRWQYAGMAQRYFVGFPLGVWGRNRAGVAQKYISRSVPHLLNAFGGVIQPVGNQGAPLPQLEAGGPDVTQDLADRLYCVRFRPKGLQPDPTPFRDLLMPLPPEAPPLEFDPNAPPNPNVPLLNPLIANNRGGMGEVMTPPDESVARYVYADCELTYEVPTYQIVDDLRLSLSVVPDPLNNRMDGLPDEATLLRYVTKLEKPAGRLITTPRNFMYYVKDAGEGFTTATDAINEGVPIYKPSAELVITWHDVPASCVPYAAIYNTLGCVNDRAFDVYERNLPAGTVLFVAVDPDMGDLPTGERSRDLRYRFLVAPNIDLAGTKRGWNAILRKVGANIDYRYISSFKTVNFAAGDAFIKGNPPYPAQNFDELFRPG